MTDTAAKTALTDASTRALLARLLRDNVRPYAGRIVWALLFMALTAGATGASAQLMEPVVNEIFIARRAEMLWLVSGGVLGVFLVKGVANYAQQALMSNVGLRIIADNQNRLFAHLTDMDVAFFHSRSTGSLLSRFLVDINQMRTAVSNGLTSLGKDLLTLLFLIGVMFSQDWELAAISFFVFPVAVYPIARLGRRTI